MQISCHNNNNFNWHENQTSKHYENIHIRSHNSKFSITMKKIQNMEEKWGCRGE